MAQRTGLSSHVLRAWERRHSIVTPVRTEGGQRLYTDGDIERLTLLRLLTERGYGIGRLALLPSEELNRLVEEEAPAPVSEEAAGLVAESAGPEAARAGAIRAIEALDAQVLKQVLERGVVALGVPPFLDEVLVPVLTEIGSRWRAGRMSIAGEHLATAVVRQVLSWVRETAESRGAGPLLVVATPSRQVHEGGALLVAATAAAEGWRVTYLGADLPIAEIADTARRTGARAVALSVLHPDDDPQLAGELLALHAALPAGVSLLVGGSSATAYAGAIETAEGAIVADLPSLRQVLRSLAVPALAQT
ncbi:MAG: MerR family transcriptional regulator [Gemmatimonadota bacterium]